MKHEQHPFNPGEQHSLVVCGTHMVLVRADALRKTQRYHESKQVSTISVSSCSFGRRFGSRHCITLPCVGLNVDKPQLQKKLIAVVEEGILS